MSAIVASEIKWYYSVKTGSAGNSTAGTAAGSLGKYISTTEWTGGSLNDLFDDISGAENAASDVEYRCVFIRNTNGANVYEAAVAYIASQVAGGASIAIGVDTTAASAIGSSSAQALEVADENTAPSGVSFSSPTTAGTGLAMGDIATGSCRALWIRRTAANTAALSADGMTLEVSGDTGSL